MRPFASALFAGRARKPQQPFSGQHFLSDLGLRRPRELASATSTRVSHLELFASPRDRSPVEVLFHFFCCGRNISLNPKLTVTGGKKINLLYQPGSLTALTFTVGLPFGGCLPVVPRWRRPRVISRDVPTETGELLPTVV